MKTLFLITFLFFITCQIVVGADQAKNPELTTVYQGDNVVWGFVFLNNSEMLITHRSGQLTHHDLRSKKSVVLSGPQVRVKGQGGLLDVQVYPHNKKTFVYFTFSEEHQDQVTTSLARGIWESKKIKNLKTLFQAKVRSTTGRHFGSRLVFKDNFIFMTVGDRGERKWAQELSTHQGKILRLTLDGKPAPGNPFLNHDGALPEIWSYGHRNPQGIDKHPKTQQIWSCEMGPKGGDELNLIQKGKNYGWPVITYGTEYHGPKIGGTQKKGMEQPVAHWVPSISPSGMAFYKGQKTEWKNNLFLANLSGQHLRRLVLKDQRVIKQEKLFSELNERFRHVRSGPDGHLYFSTDSGKIIKIH